MKMKPLAVLTIVLLYGGTSSAFAEQPRDLGTPIAAGLATQVARMLGPSTAPKGAFAIPTAVVDMERQQSAQTQPKKSMWKTPWPYVIIGGAIVAVNVIYYKSYKSGSSSSGY